MNPRRLTYTSALERWDRDGIVDALSEDVVIHVAVHDGAMPGKDIARFLFGVLAEELGPMHVTDEIMEDHKAVVLFETSIGEHTAQGLNVMTLDPAGAITELTVFFRPLESLQRIADVIGARMAARFGPAPP
ncbi:MAG: hypothetical protein H0V23_06765 [Nocardioidaceae bacterium]|nr:hypothetical protein [Nocardioidaceae bacterium]